MRRILFAFLRDLATLLWARQAISNRVSLVYLGGAGFYRRSVEYEYSYSGPLPLAIASLIPVSSTTTVTYGAGPTAGLEARIELTEHVQLVPGVRMHGVEGGWLLRPAVALGWQF